MGSEMCIRDRGKRISEFMGGFGKGIKEFKKELKDDDEAESDSESK